MKAAALRLLISTMLVVSPPIGALAGDASHAPAIKRFQRVDVRLYRGGSPTPRASNS